MRNTGSSAIFVPGEELVTPLNLTYFTHDAEPALFLYRQCFTLPGAQRESIRDGVIGLLDDTLPLPHEQTFPAAVNVCRSQLENTGLETSSLFLWCDGPPETLAPLLQMHPTPLIEARDRFGCLHQICRAPDTRAIQSALRGRTLFLADGHHRFAAGWRLATIQLRTPELQTFAAHRLVLDNTGLALPPTQPISDFDAYWAATPPGFVRFGVIAPGGQLLGLQLPCAPGERNLTVLHNRVLHSALTQPIRSIAHARQQVESGVAHLAFLVEPLSLDAIEEDARNGLLLPPKSTDFYPKLAAGMILHTH